LYDSVIVSVRMRLAPLRMRLAPLRTRLVDVTAEMNADIDIKLAMPTALFDGMSESREG
jgi:hypothetical protein